MSNNLLYRYEDACEVVRQVGILPLASVFPDHPSLDSLTPKENWHSGTDSDPWPWRAMFPADGVAAYGKFFKKKAILVSTDIFPLFKNVLGHEASVEERYQKGMISSYARSIYKAIEEEPEIETRALRAKVGMKNKELKKDFDAALVELQESLDIVISGVKEKVNELGEKNGWNSTSFETTTHWMKQNEVKESSLSREAAEEKLIASIKPIWEEQAVNAFLKVINSRK